jgi:hypothetical protein
MVSRDILSQQQFEDLMSASGATPEYTLSDLRRQQQPVRSLGLLAFQKSTAIATCG